MSDDFAATNDQFSSALAESTHEPLQRRLVTSRHAGEVHGPINRVVDPGELGRLLKPFVFLDYFNAPVQKGFGFGMHPHSGLATLTWQPNCDIEYADTTGQKGILKAGGLEWMNAGGGAWHRGSFATAGTATGFQLWVPMPPSVEDAEASGQYVAPDEVAILYVPGGLVRVLLGSLESSGVRVISPIHSFQDMNYFVLELEADATWTYVPPTAHTVAFAFPFEGSARVCGEAGHETLMVLSDKGAITFDSPGTASRVLVGSARPHPHELVLGPSSVHTNAESLRNGHQRIREIGMELKARGQL